MTSGNQGEPTPRPLNRRFFEIFTTRYWRNLRWPEKPQLLPPHYRFLAIGNGDGWEAGGISRTTPRFLTDETDDPAALSDATWMGSQKFLLVSARLLDLLQRLEPGGIAPLPIELQLRGGAVLPAGTYSLLDVTRKLPALDFERMGMEVYVEDGRRAYRGRPGTFHLRDDIPADANLFRDDLIRNALWASLAVHRACRAAGITGLGFAWPDRPILDVP